MINPQRTNIILIANVDSTFVRKDVRLFLGVCKVQKMTCTRPKGLLHFLLEQIKILIFISKNIRSSKVVICWFADYHSFIPALLSKVFAKPFYLIQGGYDTTYMPEYDYGVYTNKLRSFMVDYAYRHATLNLPVSHFLAKEIKERYNSKIKIEVLPTGYSIEESTQLNKEKSVLTVAGVDSEKRLLIKGIDRFIELAIEMPDIPFTIIGVNKSLLKSYKLPDNLICIEALSKREVDEYYKKSQIYCQFSLREGLPNAVLEAMSYECVVIGMNHSGIAEAIGDAGYVLDKWSVSNAKRLVELAMLDTAKGSEGKARVREYFNEEIRGKRLLEIINK